MKLDLKKNFDFNKIKINDISSIWLTQIANHINKSIQDGLKKGEDINDNKFDRVSDFTRDSIQDKSPHKSPLVRSDRMGETRELRPTPRKLTFKIVSGIKKSMKRWNLTYKKSKSSGTREKSRVNYGALHNQPGGYKTSSKSMIPNKQVPQREWFGIPKPMLPDGHQWLRFALQFDLTFTKFLTTAMKKFKV